MEDTIFAPATVPGTGAVSVVRISGPSALALTDSVIRFRSGRAASSPGYSVKYGTVMDGSQVLDEAIVNIYRAPKSYTGEDSVEISCHASEYVVRRLMQLLSSCGGRVAGPGEFTRRAYVNGKMDLSQAEAVADLISAKSSSAHRMALNQLRGEYSKALNALRDRIVELAALVELELDFSEEEVEFASRTELRSKVSEALARCTRLRDSFRLGNAIKNGVPVAIVGDVNSGKSTLLNALVGEDRAIVSDVAGTTRDTVEETMNLGGILYRFIDTAGIRETSDVVERMGIERSFDKMSKAEIVLVLLDVTSSPGGLEKILSRLTSGQKVLVLRNKMDLLSGAVPPPAVPYSVMDISARTGEGLPALRAWLQSESDYDPSETIVTSERHYNILTEVCNDLSRILDSIDRRIPGDLLSMDLRSATDSLGTITGTITSDEVLGLIFSSFCIGK